MFHLVKGTTASKMSFQEIIIDINSIESMQYGTAKVPDVEGLTYVLKIIFNEGHSYFFYKTEGELKKSIRGILNAGDSSIDDVEDLTVSHFDKKDDNNHDDDDLKKAFLKAILSH